MGSVYYHTVDGRIRGQTDSNRRDYLTDALGSVTATTNLAGVVENTYRAKPYGASLAKMVTGTDPRFVWAGDTGSRVLEVRFADQYNRARHYSRGLGIWLAKDKYWPRLRVYEYATSSPTTHVDPTGWDVYGFGCKKGDLDRLGAMCDKLAECLNDPTCKKNLLDCIGPVTPPDFAEKLLNHMVEACQSFPVCVVCGQQNLPSRCKDICSSGNTQAVTVQVLPSDQRLIPPGGPYPIDEDRRCEIKPAYDIVYAPCQLDIMINAPGMRGCGCIVVFCKGKEVAGSTFGHELAHCLGVGGDEGGGHDKNRKDVVYRIGSCISRVVK